MKKFFVFVLAILLISFTATFSLACGDGLECSGDQTATGFYEGNAHSYDNSTSQSGFFGNGNDWAFSQAGGDSYGNVKTNASSDDTQVLWWTIPGYAYEEGAVIGSDNSHAWTDAHDFGTTSVTSAGATNSGTVLSGGLAIGLLGCPETVATHTEVFGYVDQSQAASEVGYASGTGIRGGNESGGVFLTQNNDFNMGHGLAGAGSFSTGSITTQGCTEVSVDPHGSVQSISGRTSNSVSVDADHPLANVYGNGGLSGIAQSGGSFAGGSNAFTYNGYTEGSGNANLNATVINNGSSSTVIVTGSSTATSNGGPGLED
jgi:hypothetical protein